MQSGGTTSTEEPGGTTKARNAQTVVVNMLNHATSALHMAQNVKSVEKLITGHECADQNPNKKHEFDIEEIIEDVRSPGQEIDQIGNNHPTPVTSVTSLNQLHLDPSQ